MKEKSKKKKRIVVCDYPSKYTFPSIGYGSAEKRIWSLARTFLELLDFEVIITGPLWQPEYLPGAIHFKKRLSKDSVAEFLNLFGPTDYLFAGHEYFDKQEYLDTFLSVTSKLFTYQGNNYQYSHNYFDRKRVFLFCYSDEMMVEYQQYRPYKVLSYHGGVDEVSYLTQMPKDYLVWIGRVDKDKAPHYATLAAKILGLSIYLLGEPVYQPDYEKAYSELLNQSHVKRFGVVHGPEKMRLLSEAICGIYTCDVDYVEAGAGVLGEILRCGIPLVGLSWKGNDAISEALSDNRLGKLVLAQKGMSDDEVAKQIASAINLCLHNLDRQTIFDIATHKYNPALLAKQMLDFMD